MARRNAGELLAGAVVIAVALGFLGYAVTNTGRSAGDGYTLHAQFDRIDGLSVGSDVRMAGVKIGSVTGAALDPQTYQARVAFTVAGDVRLPKDSSAAIVSDGLLGGKYLSLEAGGDEKMIAAGGMMTITQSSISIEQLLGKFIFSAGNLASAKPGDDKPGDDKDGAPPAGGKGIAPLPGDKGIAPLPGDKPAAPK